MELLFGRRWTCTVQSTPEGVLTQTHYQDKNDELSAKMLVEPQSFAILEAVVETNRNPKGVDSCECRKITGLKGITAYFGAGKELRKIPWEHELEQFLFAENIRALIQAETSFVKERGFASDQEYEKYFREMYLNSCRYYSNLDRVTLAWVDYAALQKRFETIYSRFHSYNLYALTGAFPGPVVLTGDFSDSYHEIGLWLKVEQEIVTGARAKMLRGPDNVCYEAMALEVELIGRQFYPPPSKKEISELLGGPNGCVHLMDIAYNMGQTLAARVPAHAN